MALNSDTSGSKFNEAQSQVPTKGLSAHIFGNKSIQTAKKLEKMVNITVIEKYRSKHMLTDRQNVKRVIISNEDVEKHMLAIHFKTLHVNTP